MGNSSSYNFRGVYVAVALVFGTVGALAEAPLGEPVPSDVGIGTSEDSGPIYTSIEGMTLYSTTLDATASGHPRCSSAQYRAGTHHLGETYALSQAMLQRQKTCLEKWPPFKPSKDAEPVGKWTIIDRTEGFKQWAYRGRPLYMSSKDILPGEVNGTAGGRRRGGWSTERVPLGFPPGIKLVRTVDGLMLATADDRILFAGTTGKISSSADWAPVNAPEVAVKSGDWEPVVRQSGAKQWSYKNQLLFLPDEGMDMFRIRAAVAEGVVQPITYQPAKGVPETFQPQFTVAGWVYAAEDGKTVYTFSCSDETPIHLPCDEVGDPAVYRSSICGSGENCGHEWQPVLALRGSSRVGDWIVREVAHPPFSDAAGGYGENVPTVSAWTYRGQPVYTFSGDNKPGDINGHTIRYYGVSSFSAVKVLGNAGEDGARIFADD